MAAAMFGKVSVAIGVVVNKRLGDADRESRRTI
jgi:hypothetical protein